ncbi:kinase-like domain-containing protein [Xylogone sp. PMI_703]|nr:kinase-like domain-containing protein [Xylogone sp. PMI_703]
MKRASNRLDDDDDRSHAPETEEDIPTVPNTATPEIVLTEVEHVLRSASTSFNEKDEHHGDFARLVPANRLARSAFNEVAETLKSDGSKYPHARQFIHIDSTQVEFFAELSASDTESEHKVTQRWWTGYYRLNMNITPLAPGLGWIAGTGRKDLEHGGVDLLLAPGKGQNHVAGRHARFKHSQSGTLLLISDTRKVVINGTDEFRKDQRAITSVTTGITFGDLAYTLEFTNLDPRVYKSELERARKAAGHLQEQPSFLNPTPSGYDYELKNYAVQGVFAEGSTCTVSVGVDRKNGSPVAIKKMKRNRFNFARVMHEVDVLKALGHHERICKLLEAVYLGGDEKHTGPNNIDEVYLIYSPLATTSFHDLITSSMTVSDRLTILHQCLEGLAYIHGKGLMHRDIKPGNLVIVSRTPPRAMIIDFGSATWSKTSEDHGVGTIPYLAPEVIGLKRHTVWKPYSNKVDIWGMGLAAYQLLFRKEWLWKEVTRKEHESVMKNLDFNSTGNGNGNSGKGGGNGSGSGSGAVTNAMKTVVGAEPIELIKRMLSWDPLTRITAEDALHDAAFEHILERET